MTVLRVDHSAGGWTAIPRAALEHPALSLEAVGLLGWLLVKPHSWEVRPVAIRTRFGIGRDKWGKVTAELVAAGYYRREVIRAESGGLAVGTCIVVSPVPLLSDRTPENPEFGLADVRFTPPHIKDRSSLIKKPPPFEDERNRSVGGRGVVDQDLIELANQHRLSALQATRFAAAGHGADMQQKAALQRELKLRLDSARDRAGLAIGLARLAARGELEDTTAPALLEQQQATARRNAEVEAQRLSLERREQIAQQRRRDGPGPNELASRARLAAWKAEGGAV